MAVGIVMHMCASSMCVEAVHVSGRARLAADLSAQVNLTLSGHTLGVFRPARRALSHQQH